MRRALFLLALCAAPFVASAQSTDTPITRRDGFILLWQGLKRPAEQTNKAWFLDVPKGAKGHDEIIYAAARGIIDKAPDNFYPDEPLRLGDALVWLLRTRNVADPDDVQVATLSGFLLKYPIAQTPDETQANQPVSRDDLEQLTRSLDQKLKEEVHEASLYAEKWHGQGTAFGETFDMNAFTAAHRTYPHNTLVRVTNVANGKSVVVRINDRGPFVHGRNMDLSLASFLAIEERSKGIVNVTFERLGDASLVAPPTTSGVCKNAQSSMTTRLSRDVTLSPGIPRVAPAGASVSFSANGDVTIIAVRAPDVPVQRLQQKVPAGETFSFTPTSTGNHVFILRLANGQRKAVRMNAVECAQ